MVISGDGEISTVSDSWIASSHHAARQPPTANVFQRRGLRGLHRTDGRMVPQGRSRDLELLPHAKSYSLDCGAEKRGRLAASHRRIASTVHPANQLPRKMAGLFVARAIREEELRDLHDHGRTGRPLGSPAFLERLEGMVGRVLKPQKPGPKPKTRKSRTRKRTN